MKVDGGAEGSMGVGVELNGMYGSNWPAWRLLDFFQVTLALGRRARCPGGSQAKMVMKIVWCLPPTRCYSATRCRSGDDEKSVKAIDLNREYILFPTLVGWS